MFIETSKDAVALEDCLYCLLAVLARTPNLTSFLTHIHTLGGAHILLSMLTR